MTNVLYRHFINSTILVIKHNNFVSCIVNFSQQSVGMGGVQIIGLDGDTNVNDRYSVVEKVVLLLLMIDIV